MVKAAVFHGPENVEIAEFERPQLAEDAALLKVAHCGVCGSDSHIYSGHLPIPAPAVLGHEFVGTLAEMGPNFPREDAQGHPLKEGDAVAVCPALFCGDCYICRFVPHRNNLCRKANVYGITLKSDNPPHLFGGYAEYVNLYPNTWLFKIPDGMPVEIAALADPMACASRVVERTFQPGLPWAWEGLGAGKSVVIQGLGTIGIFAAVAAKLAGASPIIGIEMVPARAKMAKKFGVDVVIDMNEFDTPEARAEQVNRLTAGHVGADVVLEMAGVPAAFAESIMLVRPGGKIAEFGHFTDVGTVPINPHHIVWKDIDILGVFAYQNSQFATAMSILEQTIDKLPYGELITHRFPVEKAEEALKVSRSRECVKAMIVPGS